MFYSGHRFIHCIHTQIIIDTEKKIRYINSGFLGHNNDAMSYRLIDAVVPHVNITIPLWLLLNWRYPIFIGTSCCNTIYCKVSTQSKCNNPLSPQNCQWKNSCKKSLCRTFHKTNENFLFIDKVGTMMQLL